MFNFFKKEKSKANKHTVQITVCYEEYNRADDYIVGTPILNTGVKYYPVYEKSHPPYPNVALTGAKRRVGAHYTRVVEYFSTIEQAKKWISEQPEIKKITDYQYKVSYDRFLRG